MSKAEESFVSHKIRCSEEPWQRPLVFVVGPTACGKSELALRAAQRFSGAIVNADSLQLYRGLDIGTAKPSLGERSIVPHHLFDCCSPDQDFTAGDYRRMALDVVNQKAHKKTLFFVGGSGFYLQALEKGMFPVEPIDEKVKTRWQGELEARGVEALYEELKTQDPDYAARVACQDQYRIMRALQLMQQKRQKMSEIQMEFERRSSDQALKHPVVKLGLLLPRESLRVRVRERVEQMVESGLEAEVRALIKTYGEDVRPLQSVGYKETLSYICGELKPEDWLDTIVTNTMRLAKRQSTWFRRDPEVKWFDPQEGWEAPLAYLDSVLTPPR